MSKRVILLVEGQTEERFAKDVLVPHLSSRQVWITPTLLTTRRVKNGPNFKGGVTTFGKLKNDIARTLRGAGKDGLVTTLIDYYGLPKDCPGMDTRPPGVSPRARVHHVEETLDGHIDDPRFKSFFALHEFEAWLFADHEALPVLLHADERAHGAFTRIVEDFSCPEDIDEGPETAPSKRIAAIFPAYRKVFDGPNIANLIGLERIRERCPHFAAWLGWLES